MTPRASLKPKRSEFFVFSAGWKTLRNVREFRHIPGLEFARPPTEAQFADALRADGFRVDFAWSTLHMHDPAATTTHTGMHPSVALPSEP